MSYAQERFDKAINDMDRAYWQGALDGEAAEREVIVDLIPNVRTAWFLMGFSAGILFTIIFGVWL